MQQVTIVAKLPALASLWALLLGILPFDAVSPFRTLVVVVTGRLVGLPLGRPPSVPPSLRPSVPPGRWSTLTKTRRLDTVSGLRVAAGVGSKHGMGSAKREREGDSDQQAVVFHPEKRTKGLMEREGEGLQR